MKQINTLRYTGSNHVSIIADKKNNASLLSTVQATALSSEEAEAQLKADLSPQIEDEFELSITDYDRKKFTSLTTEKLLKLYDKSEKMLGAREMIEAILIKRDAISVVEPEENLPEEETKPVREYKKCMTEECLQERLAEARTNYKKFVKFLCTKDKEEHFGIIRSARLDKRSGFIQYRIEIIEAPSYNEPYEKTGRIYGKGDDSKDLTIFDEKPAEIDMVQSAPKAEENTNTDAEKLN